MVFKRRDQVGWGAWLREQIYPRSGYKRATRYVFQRMRRLPDQPHRVARGVCVGTFVGLMPVFGFQFLTAWLFARLARGNVLAALLATFTTNPVTTPIIAVLSIAFGHWLLGIQAPLNAEYIGEAFSEAGSDLWFNLTTLFGPEHARWEGLKEFWQEIYLPYLVGAIGPAVLASALGYYLSIVLVTAYQKSRAAKAAQRTPMPLTAGRADDVAGNDGQVGP